MTIADFFAVNEFTQVYYGLTEDGYIDWDEFPMLKKYIERCLENKVLYDVNDRIREFPPMARKFYGRE